MYNTLGISQKTVDLINKCEKKCKQAMAIMI